MINCKIKKTAWSSFIKYINNFWYEFIITMQIPFQIKIDLKLTFCSHDQSASTGGVP